MAVEPETLQEQKNNTMELKVVDFETAKLLKEIGFKEKTEYAYVHRYAEHKSPDYKGELINKNILHCDISAPTQELAKKWLREEFDLHVDLEKIDFDLSRNYYECQFLDWYNNEGKVVGSEFKTYEQALEEGLKKACEYLKEQS